MMYRKLCYMRSGVAGTSGLGILLAVSVQTCVSGFPGTALIIVYSEMAQEWWLAGISNA